MSLFGSGRGAELLLILVGLVVFVVFVVAGRVVARRAAKALHDRGARHDMVVVGTRVITVVFIGVGAAIAFSFALGSGNVTLAGIVIATIVASFGVQDVLKDYVSGYYVLLERHIKTGDHISVETWSGVVTEVKLRTTLLRNPAGDLIVVPNSELFNRPVTIHAKVAATPTPSAPQEEGI